MVPCYNSAGTLSRALDSALRQTWAPFEVIVIDDASSDDSVDLLKAYAKNGIVKFIAHTENRGAAAARNSGISSATGEFVAFLDADDEWKPRKLQCQIPLLMDNPRMSMVGCWLGFCWVDGRRQVVNGDREPPVGPEAWRAMLRYSFYVPTAIVARRTELDAIGGFDPSLKAGEDQDLCIRLASRGEVGFVNEVLGIMYEQISGLSRTYGSREAEIVLPMIEHHCRTLAKALSRQELRAIRSARFAQVGRNIYASAPLKGLLLLARAILLGSKPVSNMVFLLRASPPARWVKTTLWGRCAIPMTHVGRWLGPCSDDALRDRHAEPGQAVEHRAGLDRISAAEAGGPSYDAGSGVPRSGGPV